MKKETALIMLSLGMFVSAKAPSYSELSNNTNSLSIEKSYIDSKLVKNLFYSNDFKSPFELKKEEKIDYSKIPEEPMYLERKNVGKIIDSLYNEKGSPKIISSEIYKKFISKESKFDVNAYNKKSGASGLAQIRKGTWEEILPEFDYYENRFNSRKNLEVGVKYISWLERAIAKENPNWKDLGTEGRKEQIIAGYNWGIGRLKKNEWDISKAPTETKKYIEYVLGKRNI